MVCSLWKVITVGSRIGAENFEQVDIKLISLVLSESYKFYECAIFSNAL